MSSLKLKINGMHCSSCSKVISMGLEELPGIGKIEINEASKTAQVEYDENKTNPGAILKNIKDSGYEGEVI